MSVSVHTDNHLRVIAYLGLAHCRKHRRLVVVAVGIVTVAVIVTVSVVVAVVSVAAVAVSAVVVAPAVAIIKRGSGCLLFLYLQPGRIPPVDNAHKPMQDG